MITQHLFTLHLITGSTVHPNYLLLSTLAPELECLPALKCELVFCDHILSLSDRVPAGMDAELKQPAELRGRCGGGAEAASMQVWRQS